MIRIAKEKDLKRIEEIYVYARKFMAEHGNPTQWDRRTQQRTRYEKTLKKNNYM